MSKILKKSDYLEIKEDESLGWIEDYIGNVEIEMKNDVLFCDSVKWSPKTFSLNINSRCQLINFNEVGDTISIISGEGMSLDVEEESYIIFEMVRLTDY